MIYTLGLNHTTAPVAMRERVIFDPQQVPGALNDLVSVRGVNEAAILSTCNRTELYCNLEENQGDNLVLDWLSQFHRFTRPEIEPFLYHYTHRSAVQHAFRVACGLDSMVLGEPQILGQLKCAYREASRVGTIGRHLGRLFQNAFSVAKQVRTDTSIGNSPVSVAFAAVSLARQIFGNLSDKTVLLIGAGETIELAARHLASCGIDRVIVANRSVERAQTLARTYEGEAVSIPQIPDVLPHADIVISSTASPLPLLGKGLVERSLKRRRHRPIFLVDIAVPRDIEPEVGDLPDAYLYTVDDLQQVIEENMQSRQEAAGQANEIVLTRADEFMAWLRAQDAVSAIVTYRGRADDHRREVLARASSMLRQDKSPEEVLRYLAHSLTNRLTHDATQAMHEAGRDGRTELLEAARSILNLPDDVK
ncbi:MAG: glutamyl-tRNA reductase [Pseudomonadota bacterium]|nr:glutamyl-tRNA reductase [Pseudomonadota bacterium]